MTGQTNTRVSAASSVCYCNIWSCAALYPAVWPQSSISTTSGFPSPPTPSDMTTACQSKRRSTPSEHVCVMKTVTSCCLHNMSPGDFKAGPLQELEVDQEHSLIFNLIASCFVDLFVYVDKVVFADHWRRDQRTQRTTMPCSWMTCCVTVILYVTKQHGRNVWVCSLLSVKLHSGRFNMNNLKANKDIIVLVTQTLISDSVQKPSDYLFVFYLSSCLSSHITSTAGCGICSPS